MFNKDYLYDFTKQLFAIDSPSGYTHQAMTFVEKEATHLGYMFNKTKKGNGYIHLHQHDHYPTIALSAHIDTLGLMVRSISSDGTLALTSIGGPIIPTLDGEYCTIHTKDHGTFTGTILSTSPSTHVFPDASSKARSIDHMCVRLDEEVSNKEAVVKLGIQHGDFVCFDPKTVITPTDFIKSRFIDDKISVSILMTYLKYLKDSKLTLPVNLVCLFSSYEEVGHGMSHLPVAIDELISIDMGCVGLDLGCSEYDVSICTKDSTGPYDYHIVSKFSRLAKTHNIPHALDIYPFYGSDTSAALRAGHDVKGGLIGPGVSASHGMERTHFKAVNATLQLIDLYLNKYFD